MLHRLEYFLCFFWEAVKILDNILVPGGLFNIIKMNVLKDFDFEF